MGQIIYSQISEPSAVPGIVIVSQNRQHFPPLTFLQINQTNLWWMSRIFLVLISTLHPQDVSPDPTLPTSYPHQTPSGPSRWTLHILKQNSHQSGPFQISPRHGGP